MKTKTILLLTTIPTLIAYANSKPEETDAIKKLTTFNLPIEEKYEGFDYAYHNDTKGINNALITSLDDKSPGSPILNEGTMPEPWLTAMIILVKRFPEAGVKKNIYHKHTEQEKQTFKKWWAENQAYIIYKNDNTHSIAPHASPQSASPEVDQHPEDSKPATSTPRVNANPPSGIETPIHEKTTGPLQWSLLGILILSALSMIWVLIKKRK